MSNRMNLADYHFVLPPELIAHYPAKERSASRLMRVNANHPLEHHHFSHILNWLNPGDLLVFNDTKVVPARLFAKKTTGGHVEILVERILDNQRMLAQLRVSKAPRLNDTIMLASGVKLTVLGRAERFFELGYLENDLSILELIEAHGQIPLPPYITRSVEESDKERYQTVYAKHKGSVAAPTAGFHFDHELLTQLRTKEVEMGYLTLHIGAGTFAPVSTDNITNHQMHAEYITVSNELCAQIKATKARGNRVIAVGTTSMRALETAAQGGEIAPFQGDTRIFIYPGYHFAVADALITNLHLPHSSLLMLICAFGGYDNIMHAYQEAVQREYRFYSYGDAMWIDRNLT